MRPFLITTAICLFTGFTLFSQISLVSGTYTQNFNTLANSGTSSVLPGGWMLSESGSNSNTSYAAGTGSSNAGDTYSFGAAASSDRAFGGLQSGSLNPTIGANFQNNTGGTITFLKIEYTGEQWRLGATGRVDRLDFQYSTNATSLTTGSWTDVNALDFTAPVTTGSIGALDGNSAPNRTAISFTIDGLSIPNGAQFWFRWRDLDASGADDGLGVDDFSLVFLPDYTITTSGGNLVVTNLSDNSDLLELSQSGSNILIANATSSRTYTLDGGAVTTFFTTPSIALGSINSITVNARGGNDLINFQTFIANLPSLTINGGTGDDVVNFFGDITFAANANLDVDLQNDDVAPGADLILLSAFANLALSGSGWAVLRSSKEVRLSSVASLTTVDGNLTVEANQQTTPTPGNFTGVYLFGNALLQVTGTGALTVKGKGGNTSNNNYGVWLQSGSSILGGTAASTTVQGTGGLSSGSGNYGVFLEGNNSSINSAGGDVTVTGQGSGSGFSGQNHGVSVQGGAQISAGLTGSVLVNGTGGSGSGFSNYGVLVSSVFASITSSGGNVSVTGLGGGTDAGGNGIGVLINSAANISAGGMGAVTVSGTGANSTGGGNYGVQLVGSNAFINSSGGDVSVMGTGTGSASYGVIISGNAYITAGATGAVLVNGTGAVGTNSYGVFLSLGFIQSSGGNITVNGQGGSSAVNDQNNHGVAITNGSTIIAGGNGNVSVTGNGGNTAISGDFNIGVNLFSAGSGIGSNGGNVLVTGQGGGSGSGSGNIGIQLLSGTTITAGGSGTVTLNGTGSNTSGSGNYGVFLLGGTVTSSGGNIRITGTEGVGLSSVGIQHQSGSITTSTNGGNIALEANSMVLGASVDAGTAGAVAIRQRTNNVPINLGAAADPVSGPLGLQDSELDQISAGTLIIGNANSGTITVSDNITRPAATNVELVSGGDVSISGGGFNASGGNLLLDPGASPAAVKVPFSGTDVGANTVSFGSDLAIVINGTNPGTDYTQLTVFGSVDLTGVTLVLSGSHTPVAGQTFIVVDNDGPEAIIGAFTGLPEGGTVSNFLGSGLDASITYLGGSGNDAVLTVLANNAPPVAVCQNITVNADGSCQANPAASAVDNGSSDPDSDPLTFSLSPAGPYALGPTAVTLTVDDGNGGMDQCNATITVADATPPAITCPPNITLNTPSNACDVNSPPLGTPGASDNCGAPTVTNDAPMTFVLGPTTVTWTADDGVSTSTCEQIVTIEPYIAPPGEYFDLVNCISTPCPPGSYCPGATTAGIPCPAGSFSSTSGAEICDLCPAGRYQDQTGQTACIDCLPGSFSATPGATSCALCTAGTSQGLSGQTACVACPPGFFSSADGATSCNACDAGTYQSASGQTSCLACLPGTFSSSMAATSCTACEAGKFQGSSGQTGCLDCPAGSFSSTTGAVTCTLCPAGTSQGLPGQTACVDCVPGFFSATLGAIACSACPVNTFSNTSASTSCAACPPGTFSAPGSTLCTTSIPPDITVRGNGVVIVNRTLNVSVSDHTDFGSVLVAGGMVTRSFSIENIVNGQDLRLDGVAKVTVAGRDQSDFSVSMQPALSSVPGGAQTTFDVTFDPGAAGLRTALIVITHNDFPDNPFVFTVRGEGN